MSKPEIVAASVEPAGVPGQTAVQPRASGNPDGSRGRLFGAAVFATVLAAVFGRHLVHLAMYVAEADLHSHILLVPFITAYLLYIRWKELPKVYGSAIWPALLALGAATAAWLAAHSLASRPPGLSENDYLALLAFAFVCGVAAGGFAFLGRPWMRGAAFPMFFLIFLVPLPDAAVDWLETASKLGSAEMANFFFIITGTPMLRDGLVFQLPGITIEVAQECSGIRSSWVLFITSLLASNLFLRTTWRRAVLVLFVIPLGLIRNGFRILVIGLLCVHIGPEMIHSIIHKRGGPLFFALSLIPLFGLLAWLRRSERGDRGRKSRDLPEYTAVDGGGKLR